MGWPIPLRPVGLSGVLLSERHESFEPLHVLPVEMLSERPARRRQRDDIFGIGAELAAIKAVRVAFPCLIVVDCLIAGWAAHWSLLYLGYCNCEAANKFPPLERENISNFNRQQEWCSARSRDGRERRRPDAALPVDFAGNPKNQRLLEARRDDLHADRQTVL
jgi:hypothetical protein